MSTTPLQILQQLTKPKSADEVRVFLIERHRATVRENASSDVSALDEVALKALGPIEG